jgi:hypothetical protein
VQLMAANATSTTWYGAPLTVSGKNHDVPATARYKEETHVLEGWLAAIPGDTRTHPDSIKLRIQCSREAPWFNYQSVDICSKVVH